MAETYSVRSDIDNYFAGERATLVRRVDSWDLESPLSDGEDIVDESYMRAVKYAKGEIGFLKAWSRSIMYNEALAAIEKTKRIRDSERIWEPPQDGATLYGLSKEELRAILLTAVDKLGRDRRTCIILRYFEGLSNEQIAKIENVKSCTVRRRVGKGLEDLRTSFKREKLSLRDFL